MSVAEHNKRVIARYWKNPSNNLIPGAISKSMSLSQAIQCFKEYMYLKDDSRDENLTRVVAIIFSTDVDVIFSCRREIRNGENLSLSTRSELCIYMKKTYIQNYIKLYILTQNDIILYILNVRIKSII